MDALPGLLLNGAAFARVPEQNKVVFVYEWLRSLDHRLSQSTKADVRDVQQALTDQLMVQVVQGVGPPSRKLLGRCLAKIFTTGDSISLYSVLNSCNDVLKVRDDNPTAISKRLTALTCLATIYRSLGRLCGRTFEATVGILTKMLRQVESQSRSEILNTLRDIVVGVGCTETSCFRDIFKASRSLINDRVLPVRLAAFQCLNSLSQSHSHFFTNDLDALMSMCVKGLDGSNHPVRMEIAKLLGFIMAKTQKDSSISGSINNPNSGAGPMLTNSTSSSQNAAGHRVKPITLDDIFNLLSSTFLRGPSRFHKSSSNISREVRAGIIYVYEEFFNNMGSEWVVRNSPTVFSHCFSLLLPVPSSGLRLGASAATSTSSASAGSGSGGISTEGPMASATATPNEAAFTRLCVSGHLLPRLLRRHFAEAAQIAAARYILHLISQRCCLQRRPNQDRPSGFQAQLRGLGRGLRSVGSTGHLDESGEKGTEESCNAAYSPPMTDDPSYLIGCQDVLTQVVRWLDSCIAPVLASPCTFVETICETCLCHSSLGVRVSAAALLRQLAVALPGQRVALMERCMAALGPTISPSAESISGHSLALGGLVASTRLSDLGIPCARGKAVFSLAEDLLRAANQNSRLTMARTHAGWYLMGACMTLGPNAVRPHLPRLILLWRNAFPRSTRELEAEKQRGDAFTWQVTLEARAGALCSVQAFLEYCATELSAEGVTRRLLALLESALGLLGLLPDVVRTFGSHLAAPAALLRTRLYRCLALLPPTAYSSGFNVLLRELVAEFTLTDTSATTAVCLAGLLGQSEDSVVHNSWCRVSDQQIIEDALEQHNFCCPGSLSNDPARLFLRDGLASAISSDLGTVEASHKFILEGQPEVPCLTHRKQHALRPPPFTSDDTAGSPGSPGAGATAGVSALSLQHRTGPPALATQVIEASIELFGLVFPYVSTRHRAQMLEHFNECVRVTKAPARQEAVQVNVLAAILTALRHLSETKYGFGEDKTLRSSAISLTMGALSSGNGLLRSAAAECVGRLAQVVGEGGFLAEVAGSTFEQLRGARDSQARAAGLCAAVGCLHRFVGGLACAQHLNTSVALLLALAQDSSAPALQAWALNALAQTAESGGPMFREFVQPSLNLVLRLLLKTPFSSTDIHSSLANLLGALITTLGPELQSTSGGITSSTGLSCLLCCSTLLEHPDPLLQAEGISNFQRIHVFAPHLVNLSLFAPFLFAAISSHCFSLRRAAISCIRQISHKDADSLCDLMAAVAAANESQTQPSGHTNSSSGFIGTLPGETATSLTAGGVTSESVAPLEAILFSLLDVETESKLRSHLEEAISSLLLARGLSHFPEWMRSLKQLLQLTTSTFQVAGESGGGLGGDASGYSMLRISSTTNQDGKGENDAEADDDDDEQSFGGLSRARSQRSGPGGTIFNLPPRWPTRILAIACLRRLMCLCYQASELANANSSSVVELDLCKPQSLHSDLSLPIDTSLTVSSQQRAHFDLALARRLRRGLTDAPWLVLHLSDLVRVTFISATANSDHLRRFGLFALKQVIQFFAPVVDPDSAGNYLLEQFQAQISAALSPAFTTTTPFTGIYATVSTTSSAPLPDITAAACEVCACWLTSGVTREAADLRRVHDLLSASLEILRSPPPVATSGDTAALFSEACVTRLKLAVLSAWAEVFIASARFRETALHTIQLLSMLESQQRGKDAASAEPLCEMVQRQMLMMLGGGSGRTGVSWGKPSVCDASKLVDALEKEVDDYDFEEEEEEDEETEAHEGEGGEVSNRVDCGGDGGFGVKRKRLIRKSRRTVNESRHSYQLLSRLIGPYLVELASDWLAALRDYALINLPDELAFQRPTTAGAFYDAQTGIDAVRPFYARSWLALLEAATLCLHTESKCSSDSAYPDHGNAEKITVIPMTRGSFYLIFGIAMEAMSDVVSKPPSSVVSRCLRIVELLLMNPASRPYLFASTPRLPVELLSVLHRIVLTRDSISLHLACLRVLHLLLAASDDRLRTALTADLDPSGAAGNETEAEVTSVWLESDQSLEELLGVLVCPSATDMESLQAALELADGGSRSCFAETPETACKFTLTTLQVIVCLMARYHPSVLQSPVPEMNPPVKTPTMFPKSSAARHRKAPIILACTINALTALLRIVSPKILSTSPQKPISGVLPVMCRLIARIAQLELLKPTPVLAKKAGFGATATAGGKTADAASFGSMSTGNSVNANASTVATGDGPAPPDVGNISASAFKSAVTTETDITSTSSGANESAYPTVSMAVEAAAFSTGVQGKVTLNAKVGWSQEQACLADALVTFLATVAQHHCRAVSPGADSASAGETDTAAVEGDAAVSSSGSRTKTVASAGALGDTPSCEWYQLVIACLLTFVQHDHKEEGSERLRTSRQTDHEGTATCCLAAVCLAARVVAAAPLAVFRCRAVEFGVFEMLTRAWRKASSSTSSVAVRAAQPPSLAAPLGGATTRVVCLSAIELLVNHNDADISSCCVKTLMPQVFNWLYELSVAVSTGDIPRNPPNIGGLDDFPLTLPLQQAYKVFLCRLEEAVSAAIALSLNVVDIAEASGRQNLLVILLPLFCDLLYDENLSRGGGDEEVLMRRMLHRLALKNLLALGARYPVEFRHVVGKVPSLKPRIETAVKAAGGWNNVKTSNNATKTPSDSASGCQQPPRAAIKLKMEFSNFTSS